jgi:hypothetical protein
MRRISLISSLLVLGLSACQGNPLLSTSTASNRALLRAAKAPIASKQTFLLSKQTRVLNEPINQPLQATPGQLVFTGQRVFNPGEVVIGRSSQGQAFLGRVLQNRVVGSQTLVQIAPASLADAFQELDLTGINSPEAIKPIELDRRSFQLGFVTIESALKAYPDLSDFKLRLQNGKALFVRFAPEIKLTWDITARATLTSALDVPWAGAAPASPNPVLKPIGEVNFKTFTIATEIGPIPITIFIKPGAALEWAHQGTGTVELGGQINGRFKAGVEMTARLSQSPELSTSYDYDYGGVLRDPRLEFTGKIQSRLHLPRLRVESEIAAMVGPYIEASSYLDADLTARMTVVGAQKRVSGLAEAHLGLALKAGLPKSDLFGQGVPELHKSLFNRRVKQIYKKELNYSLPLR